MKQAQQAEGIVVCGTGIAGLACALALARQGEAVTLLGPRPALPEPSPTWFHPRVYALSAASRALLDRLGVWGLMDASRISPVEAMELYGDGEGAVTLSAWQDARDAMAWIVESGELERALRQVVRIMGIAWHEETLASLEARPHDVRMTTSAGHSLTGALLIGADGARSAVRRLSGIGQRYRAYGDLGVVAHLDIERAHQHRAFQWFCGESVLALLPLPDTPAGAQASLVWSLPEASARAWLAQPPDGQQAFFAARMQAITAGRLGHLRLRTQPRAFPLVLARSAMVAARVALVGDAAHRVHPLAGQGLNLGLGDVAALADILRARAPFHGPGDVRVLSRYRRARAEPVLAMSMVTDGLHRLFGTRSALVAHARNQGMRWLDDMPFLKRRLIRAAAGE